MALERPLPPSTVLSIQAERIAPDSPSKVVQKREREAWIRLGIELVDRSEREILALHEWEGKTFVDIGKHYGISKDAARMRFRRALKRLSGLVTLLRKGQIRKSLESGTGMGIGP